jgi:excisionase family DNA binding protein
VSLEAKTKIAYAPKEAATALGLGIGTIYMLLQTGQLKTTRAGTRHMIPAAELERFAKRPRDRMWPPKQNGKTVNTFVLQVVEEASA